MHSGQTLSSQRPPLLQRLITPNPLSSLMKQIILGTTDSRPRGGELAHYLNFCEDMQLWALAHAFLVLDDHIMAGVVGGWEAADSLLGLDVQCLLHTLVSPMCCSATKKIRWSEGGRLQGRAHAPRTIGRTLQESGCNLFFFQKCLCKIWDVNYQKFIWNISPVSIKKYRVRSLSGYRSTATSH
jgi:hypothetical protein